MINRHILLKDMCTIKVQARAVMFVDESVPVRCPFLSLYPLRDRNQARSPFLSLRVTKVSLPLKFYKNCLQLLQKWGRHVIVNLICSSFFIQLKLMLNGMP